MHPGGEWASCTGPGAHGRRRRPRIDVVDLSGRVRSAAPAEEDGALAPAAGARHRGSPSLPPEQAPGVLALEQARTSAWDRTSEDEDQQAQLREHESIPARDASGIRSQGTRPLLSSPARHGIGRDERVLDNDETASRSPALVDRHSAQDARSTNSANRCSSRPLSGRSCRRTGTVSDVPCISWSP